ncbi:hypothetical protein DSO57_1014468 [Entomophthora muscae]|uniref:Uncharacterized protein n=1 Tax=Entomophthora muscae TaxID=34485 RepID=A0ACC2RWU0_9FUNG|nr:hypothetical protein DSO57_1014468 [Entomophthora muscae]
MTDRGREFIGNEFTSLLQEWYRSTEGLAPAEVQVYGGDVCLVIGKVLEGFAVMQAKYKLLINHSPLLGNDSSSKLVPGYDPGHTLGTGDQEPHSMVSGCPRYWPTGEVIDGGDDILLAKPVFGERSNNIRAHFSKGSIALIGRTDSGVQEVQDVLAHTQPPNLMFHDFEEVTSHDVNQGAVVV